MDEAPLIEVAEMLVVIIGALIEDHHLVAIQAPPSELLSRYAIARTLQQLGRDTDVLSEAAAILLRRARLQAGDARHAPEAERF